jgi:hypothetical protein
MPFKKVNKRALALNLVGANPGIFSLRDVANIIKTPANNLHVYIADGSFVYTGTKEAYQMVGNSDGTVKVIPRTVKVVSLSKKGLGRRDNAAGKSSAPFFHPIRKGKA